MSSTTGRYGPNSTQVERFLSRLARVSTRQWVREAEIGMAASPAYREKVREFHAMVDAEIVAAEGRMLHHLLTPQTSRDPDVECEAAERRLGALTAINATIRKWGLEEQVAAAAGQVVAIASSRFKPEGNLADIIAATTFAVGALVCRQVLDVDNFQVLYEPVAKVVPLESPESTH